MVNFTNDEIINLKKWLAWQAQAAITFAISLEMDEKRDDQEALDALRIQHDIEAEKCKPLLQAFKDSVKDLEIE